MPLPHSCTMRQGLRALGLRSKHGFAGVLALAALGSASAASASGLEIPELGAVGLGRGGAVVARASDASAMLYNPAAMLGLAGAQVSLGSSFGSFSQCFQRFGNYANEDQTGVVVTGTVFEGSRYAASGMSTPFPRTCNNPSLSFSPNLAFSYRILPNLAVGISAAPPHAVGREGIYPETVMTANGLAPSPARHLLYEKRLLLFYPAVSVAFAPVPWLRLGATAQLGYANFEYSTMLNPNDQSGFEQSPDADIKLTLGAQGLFFAGAVGAQVILPRFFTIGVKAQIVPQLNLQGPNQGRTVDSYYSTDMTTLARRTSQFNISALQAQPPSHVRAGVRFALPRPGRPTEWESVHRLAQNNTVANGRNMADTYDPMRDDVFDIEVDFNYEFTSSLSTTSVSLDGTILAGGVMVAFDPTKPIVIQSNFNNTFGVRVGGDWNIIPDRFAMRMGFSAETGASRAGLSQIHLPTYDSFSASLGATLRVSWFNVGLSYAHNFFMPFEDPTGSREIITTAALRGEALCGPTTMGNRSGSCSINAGRYDASMDLVAINLSGRW